MARTVTLSAVTLDCPNPHELAAFYAALLGVEVGWLGER
jgi:hypothetical protein